MLQYLGRESYLKKKTYIKCANVQFYNKVQTIIFSYFVKVKVKVKIN